MPLVNGTLTDFGLDPLQLAEPVLLFRASSPGITGLNILSSRKAVEAVPAGNGFFEVDLVATTLIAPESTHYTVEIRYRDPVTGMMVSEVLPWKLLVPPEGGALGDLLRVPANPALVWTGTEPPLLPSPGVWWLDPSTGDLSEMTQDGTTWAYKANLRGPAGYNATGAAEDDAAIADLIAETAGPTETSAAVALQVEAGIDANAARFAATPDTVFFAPLAKARNAAAVRSNWWISGDSKEESYGASDLANRSFAQLQDKLRAMFPSGAAGGNFRPPRYNTTGTAWANVFAYTGAGANVGIGFAHRGRQLSYDAATPGKATLTGAVCTQIEVFFWRLSADSAEIWVDDVLLATHVLPVTGSKASVYASAVLPVTAGNVHKIEIRHTGGANSAPVLAGINLINGDKTRGLHLIDNTISGGKTSGFVGQAGDTAGTIANKESWAEFVPLLTPELFVFEFLTNDIVTDSAATYEANVRKFITLARTKAGKTVPFLLMPPEEPSDRVFVEPWRNYLDALDRIAGDTPAVRFYDISRRIPKQGNGNPNGIYMDAVHYAPHFQVAWADHHMNAITGQLSR